MKILEQGAVKEWSIQVRCTGKGNGQEQRACKSLLEVGYGDLFRTEDHMRDDVTYYITFKCISCGVLTDIPDSDVPREIRAKLFTANPRPSTNTTRVHDHCYPDHERDYLREEDRMHRPR